MKIRFQAYQTLYECLENYNYFKPINPFYMDQLFKDLNSVSEKIHLIVFISQIFQNQISLR